MVSHFFCVTDANVCPKRAALMASSNRSAAPAAAATAPRLDEFVLAELRGPPSSGLNQQARPRRTRWAHAQGARQRVVT